LTDPPVWQTDGQTELPWHIRAIAYMLSRVKICIHEGNDIQPKVFTNRFATNGKEMSMDGK